MQEFSPSHRSNFHYVSISGMVKLSREMLVLVCLLASLPPLTSSAVAQTPKKFSASGHSDSRLKLIVILSRHGVRSPTWTQDHLDAYSASPWPKWSVPPGNLTSRGFELMKQFGN